MTAESRKSDWAAERGTGTTVFAVMVFVWTTADGAKPLAKGATRHTERRISRVAILKCIFEGV